MEIEFAGEHDKETYFKAVAWVFRPTKREWILRIGAFVLFGGIYITLLFTVFREDSVSTLEISRIIRHLFTFLVLGYIVIQPALRSKQVASKLWADPVVRRKISGRAAGTGIQIEPSKDWMEWDDFVKVYKTEDQVVLLTARRTFLSLPRSFFKSEADWKHLQEMAASRVKEVIE